MGLLGIQKVFSGELAGRNIFLHPPEPAAGVLLSSPVNSIFIGKTSLQGIPFFWNHKKLVNPHLCVCGITGAGKSYFIKTFITRASLVLGASSLILDWSGEYSRWVQAAGGKVISLGSEGVNLLDCAGQPPHARCSQILSAFETLGVVSGQHQRLLLQEALEAAYRSKQLPLDRVARPSARLPNLQDVIRCLLKKSPKEKEARQLAASIKNLLQSSEGAFLRPTIRIKAIINGLVSVDLHSLPSEQARSLAGLSILQMVKEQMRNQMQSEQPAPKLFVVLDEAWKIASDERSDAVALVREGRKYGFGLIISSQNPTDVHRTIFSNAGTVLCFRLTLASERQYVRSSLSYSDYYESQSHSLAVGQALVHLEPSDRSHSSRDFILGRVDGEEPLSELQIRGGGMDLRIEKDELRSELLAMGLNERQANRLLQKFESHAFSLEASDVIAELEQAGLTRAAAFSFLRALGAGERQLLAAFSSRSARGKKPVSLRLVQEG